MFDSQYHCYSKAKDGAYMTQERHVGLMDGGADLPVDLDRKGTPVGAGVVISLENVRGDLTLGRPCLR